MLTHATSIAAEASKARRLVEAAGIVAARLRTVIAADGGTARGRELSPFGNDARRQVASEKTVTDLYQPHNPSTRRTLLSQ